jgi:hypothetical protein
MTNQAIRGHDWSGGVGSYDMSPGRGNEVVPPFVPDPPKGQRDEMSNGAVWNGDLPAPQPRLLRADPLRSRASPGTRRSLSCAASCAAAPAGPAAPLLSAHSIQLLAGVMPLFRRRPDNRFTLRELMEACDINETGRATFRNQAYNNFHARITKLFSQAEAANLQLPFVKYQQGHYAFYGLRPGA